jgi:hypothetical protein
MITAMKPSKAVLWLTFNKNDLSDKYYALLKKARTPLLLSPHGNNLTVAL